MGLSLDPFLSKFPLLQTLRLFYWIYLCLRKFLPLKWKGKFKAGYFSVLTFFLVWAQTPTSVLTFWRVWKSLKEVFCKKDVLRNFAKFTGKHLCQSLSFNKVACLRSATLLKKRLWHRFFPVNFAEFCKISKNTFSYRTPPVAASENAFPLPSSVYLRDKMDENISNFILLVK